MDELTKVRLATIIDCEGTIAIYNYNDGRSNFHKPVVDVSQDNVPYLEQFFKVFGFGTICRTGSKDGLHYKYQVCYIQALIICIELYDYFQLKKDKAKLIIDFYINKMNKGYYGGWHNKHKNYNINTWLKRYNLPETFISDFLDIKSKEEKKIE
jgi:hypothetical protein